MSRSTHRVAIVIFCEAEGVDARDASYGAELAIGHALRQVSQNDADAQAKVPSSRTPQCSQCGARAGIDDTARIVKHVQGESFYPDPDPDMPDYTPEVCAGAGQPAASDTHPVVGYTRPDGLPIYARIHETMDVDMAAGNGYLRTEPTWKAFRH